MEKFWELLRESVIVQGLVTLILLVTTCYMYATGQDVPDPLLALDSVVVGFFFGSKFQNAVQSKTK